MIKNKCYHDNTVVECSLSVVDDFTRNLGPENGNDKKIMFHKIPDKNMSK